MSDLGSQIQDEIAAIEQLKTAAETPDGQLGDDWDGEYEAFAHGVATALDSAAPDSIRNSDGEITANVNNDVTNSGELLLTQYASADDAPAGSGVGIIGVTSDGHLLMEDGQ